MVECLVANENVRSSTLLSCSTHNIMYRVYYTDPKLPHVAGWQDISVLSNALECCEFLRRNGMLYVTMVSDYANMVGKPGASGPDTGYVAQMLS